MLPANHNESISCRKYCFLRSSIFPIQIDLFGYFGVSVNVYASISKPFGVKNKFLSGTPTSL